ncbi:MAG: TolC family protein [Bdellovibrionota bacterium]
MKLSFPVFAFFLLLPLSTQAAALPLSQAVNEAEAQNPQLQKSSSELEELKWKHTEALSGFLPSVTGSASYLLDKRYAYLDIALGGSMLSIPQVVPTATYGLSGRLPIFDGWANVDRYRAAGDLVQAGTLGLDWTRFQLDRNVVLLYYKALGAKLLQDVAAQNLATLEDHLKDAQAFKKAGVSTNFDVLRVEVQVSEARSALIDAGDSVAVARQSLAEALGKTSEDRPLTGELPVLKPEILHALRERTDEERKDIQSLRARAGAMDKLEGAAGSHFVPKLFLFGDYQHYNNRDNSVWSSTAFREAYDVGIGLSWNIFDGLGSIAKSKEAIEERVQAEKTLDQAELHSVRDLELWKRKFLYFCQVYGSRQSDVEKARESVRLARAGRRVGARTNTDLLDAESDFNRAQAGLVNSQLGAIEALLNVELATGRHLYNFY